MIATRLKRRALEGPGQVDLAEAWKGWEPGPAATLVVPISTRGRAARVGLLDFAQGVGRRGDRRPRGSR